MASFAINLQLQSANSASPAFLHPNASIGNPSAFSTLPPPQYPSYQSPSINAAQVFDNALRFPAVSPYGVGYPLAASPADTLSFSYNTNPPFQFPPTSFHSSLTASSAFPSSVYDPLNQPHSMGSATLPPFAVRSSSLSSASDRKAQADIAIPPGANTPSPSQSPAPMDTIRSPSHDAATPGSALSDASANDIRLAQLQLLAMGVNPVLVSSLGLPGARSSFPPSSTPSPASAEFRSIKSYESFSSPSTSASNESLSAYGAASRSRHSSRSSSLSGPVFHPYQQQFHPFNAARSESSEMGPSNPSDSFLSPSMASESLFVNQNDANSRSLSPGSGSSTKTSKSNTPIPPFSPPSESPSLFYREAPSGIALSSLPPHPTAAASSTQKGKAKPKLPRSAYTFYVSHQRTGVRLLSSTTSSPSSDCIDEDAPTESAEFAGSSPASQTKHRRAFRVAAEEVGKRWREMSAEEKAPFVELAKQDKERYVRETLENLSEQLKSSGTSNVSPQQMEMLNAAKAGRGKGGKDAK